MRTGLHLLLTLAACLTAASQAFAMEAQATRLVVWARGETIQGEDFTAATEAVVDYIATLRRPTGVNQRIIYDCMAKSRVIQPSVVNINGTDPFTAYVEVRTVYELRDCAEHAER